MNNDQAIDFILSHLPCPVRQIDLPSNVKAKALRTLRERNQIIKQRDDYVDEYFYAINPDYRDVSVKSRVLNAVVTGTTRISVLKDKVGCSKSAAYEAVKLLIAEDRVKIIAKDTGRFLIAI